MDQSNYPVVGSFERLFFVECQKFKPEPVNSVILRHGYMFWFSASAFQAAACPCA